VNGTSVVTVAETNLLATVAGTLLTNHLLQHHRGSSWLFVVCAVLFPYEARAAIASFGALFVAEAEPNLLAAVAHALRSCWDSCHWGDTQLADTNCYSRSFVETVVVEVFGVARPIVAEQSVNWKLSEGAGGNGCG